MPIKNTAFFLLAAFFFVLICQSFLEAQPFHLEIYDTQDGLMSSNVTALCQDSKNLLWIGTSAGLSRYDGYSFQNYSVSAGLPPQAINGLIEDEEGFLWISSEAGLAIYDGNTFSRLPFAKGVNEIITAIHLDNTGKLWIGTNQRLAEVKDHWRRTAHHSPDSLRVHFFPQAFDIEAIEDNGQGTLFFSNGNELIQFDGQVFKTLAAINDEAVSMIRSIFVPHPDTVWLGSEGGTVFKYWDGTLQMLIARKPTSYMASAMVAFDDRIWILDANEINIVSGSRIEPYTLYDKVRVLNLQGMILDREHNFWIGGDGGLIKMTPSHFSLYPQFNSQWQHGIYSFGKDDQGKLLIGANHGDIFVRTDAGTFDRLPLPETRGSQVNAIWLDRRHHLWYASFWKGLYRKTPTSVEKYFYEEGIRAGADLLSLYEAEPNLWVGTTDGLSRLIINERTGEVDTVVNYNESYGLGLASCHRIIRDSFQTLWIGTSKGLFYLKDDHPQKYPLAIAELSIADLEIDRAGNLWLATQGWGILQLKIKAEGELEFVAQITEQNGLSSNFLLSLALDDYQNLWAGTYQGISHIRRNPDSLHIINYYPSDGLIQRAYESMDLFNDGSGTIWVATSSGLMSFQPAEFQLNTTPPPVYLQKLVVNSQEISMGDLVPGKPLELRYHQNRLRFDFTAVGLKNPSKLRYQFRLNTSDHWSAPSNSRSVTYNYLDDGSYTFMVKASNEDGVWSEEPFSFPFVVKPPFWETSWFIGGLLLLMVGSLFGYISIREKRIKEREQEKSRIRQLMAELETKALRAQMNPHFIFNCLNAIQECILSEKMEAAAAYLLKFSRLLRMVLESSTKNRITIQREVEILSLYLQLEALRFDEAFAYDIVLEGQEVEEVLIPTLMVQPFVENAIWHGLLQKTGTRKLSISFSTTADTLMCQVRDNGIGRQRARALSGRKIFKHQAMALQLIKDRIKIIGEKSGGKASIEITDLKDSQDAPLGTLVTITLPNDLTTIEKV